MFFCSTGACTEAKSPIANHHSQINAQLYSASPIRHFWQRCHSDYEFDALQLSVYCKFRDSKRCWQRYSAATDLCLFDWLGVKLWFLWMLPANFNSMCNMPLRHKSLVHSRNRRLCWQRPSQNTCFSSEIDLIMKWPSLLHDSSGRCVSMIYFSCIRLYHLVVLLQNLL